MAVGARITSENLSGKTATVTFTPYTGSTSGTTQNLGTKTIPFNNITSHPYGDYNLYFAEYDYTYTLNIPEPYSGIQSFVMCAPLSGSTNYSIGFLNFNDLTATVLDLGFDSNDWNVNNVYPIQEKGYAYHFQLNSDYNTRKVVFTDSENNVIGSYSGVTSDWSYDDMDGKWNIVWDYDGGVAYYSNGENVYTYTWDPAVYNFDFDWNNYAVTADNTFIIILTSIDTAEKTSYLVSNTNQITEMEVWSGMTYSKDYFQSPSHTFIPSLSRNISNSQYNDIKFFDTTGTQIGSTISLTGNTYDNYSYRQYGENRFAIVLWYNSDVDIDYKIIHFDGETNSVINTTRTRGTNYQTLIMEGNDNSWPDEGKSTCLYMAFCHSLSWNDMVNADYCDIVYMLGTQTSFNTHNLTSGTTVNFYPSNPGEMINIPFVDGDLVIKVLSFNGSGAQTITTSISSDGTDKGFWDWYMNGLGAVLIVWSNNYDGGNVLHMDTPGNLADNLPFTLSGSWQFNVSGENGLFFFTDYTNSYYLNTTSNGFVTLSGESYNQTYDTYFGDTDNITSDILLLFNSNNGNARILTSTDISNVVTLPENNGNWGFNVGKNYVMYTYGDVSTDLTTVKLYDRTFNLVNTLTTTHTNGWNDTYGVKDRFVLITSDDYKYSYMITPTTTEVITQSNNNTDYTVNDFYYWND